MRRRASGSAKRYSGASGRFNRHQNRHQKSAKSVDISKYVRKAIPVEEVAFVPNHTFKDFVPNAGVLRNVDLKGYKEPTPIQDKAIPVIREGVDFVGIANTGTGKTAAFLLPLLEKVMKDPHQNVIILAPTRELAMQINHELVSYASGTNVWSVLCVGGDSIGKQIMALRRSHNFVIGTPGRIKDLFKRKALLLHKYNNVVLDEADRMLDMGFITDIKNILGHLPKIRHSLFFSATINPQVRSLMDGFMNDPVVVSVKKQETAANVEQNIVKVMPGQDKLVKLVEILNNKKLEKVLVFGRTKRGVEKLSVSLRRLGFKADSIHGDKTQSRRRMALSLFRENKIRILVATDIVARGLDIPAVSHVINFDLPENYDDYVHRIGRTGRASATGTALTFV